MRTVSLTHLAPVVGALALALAASPASASQQADTIVVNTSTGTVVPAASTAWTGVFRVQLALAGKDAAPAALVLERSYDAPSGFMLVDSRGTPLSKIRIEGDVLHARVDTEQGVGQLTLRLDGATVTGTLMIGKQKWDVMGQKTA